jgi:hypothetical protein
VATDTCYQYQQRATDNVGNTTTSTPSNTVKVDTAPTITSVTLDDGGSNPGRIGSADTIVVTFSQQMRATSLCPEWNTGDGDYYSITANNAVIVSVINGTGSTNDRLEVTTASGCSTPAAFGSLDLGASTFVSNNVQFRGNNGNASTVAWNGASSTLTIRIGRSGTSVSTPTSPRYSNNSIQDSAGIFVSNSPFTAITGAF